MKKIILNLRTAFFILCGLLFLNITFALALPEDAILAVVNDEVITYRDLGEYLKARVIQLKAEGVPESEIKKISADLESNGLKRLVQDKLIINEANRKAILPRREVVDKRLKEIEDKYPSETVFLDMLAQDGMTISDLKKRIEDQIKVQQLIDDDVKAKIYVNPQEITDFYKANINQYQKPEQINLDSIFIAKGTDPSAAKQKIQKALELIKAKQEFRKVAEEYSESPAIGNVAKGKLLNQIEEKVWPLEVGQMTDVIEVDNGFYIFQILGKTPSQTATLDEVKDTIKYIVFQEKFAQKLTEWLDQLQEKAFVEIK
jgi:peptidyl-prolyl cis-trans isomerase SurA